MPQAAIKNAEDRMEKAIQALQRELTTLRAGRATPALLDRVQAEYYGALTPINQLASVNAPDSRTLIIQPWDSSSLSAIEKALLKSDVGITPSNDGAQIRLTMPMLTEERRLELVKSMKKYAEEAKVAIRNIRRDVNDELKKMEKTTLSEDESRRYQEDVQKKTDKFTQQIDKICVAKEKEIMEV